MCAAKGYPLHIVSSDAFSREKLDHMAALGATLTLVPSEGGRTTKALIEQMIATARHLGDQPRTYWVNQLHNADAVAAYGGLGEEIWSQTRGTVRAFVQGVGTGASLRGTVAVLKRYSAEVRSVAVEPAESPVLSGGVPGAHHIEGIGVGFMPPLWDATMVDRVIAVSTDDVEGDGTMPCARRRIVRRPVIRRERARGHSGRGASGPRGHRRHGDGGQRHESI